MVSSSLTTFFTTLAQVSFTVSGLMAVAIAGDDRRRSYWFRNEARSLFAYISFLLLLLPGFVSIGGLVPLASCKTPSWVYACVFLGSIYFLLAITFFFKKRKLAEPEEFRRLEIRFSKVNREMGSYGGALLIAFFFGAFAPGVLRGTETFLGIVLFFSIVSGALASVILLRSNEVDSSNEDNRPPRPEQKSDIPKPASNHNLYSLVVLLVAATAFLIGIVVKRKRD